MRIASVVLVLAVPFMSLAAVPTDNPVATYYGVDEGYPAWTDRLAWDRVIDMSAYEKGKTNFEKFENARDELAEQGGGVLYYPAGEYDFSDGPFDGPNGRGLMLRKGVVIRGEAPQGKPIASKGRDLELPTRFVFGFNRQDDAVDVGERLTVVLDGAEPRHHKERVDHRPLILSFAVKGDKIGKEVKAFRRLDGRTSWPGSCSARRDDNVLVLKIDLQAGSADEPVAVAYTLKLDVDADAVNGTFEGTFGEDAVSGKASGSFLTIIPETPRDWNMIGLAAGPEGGVKDVDRVGVAWVHLVGGVVFFGADVTWGPTWATAKAWKSSYTQNGWGDRKPDGTHPWDCFAGGGKPFVGSGDGRLVFGCKIEQATVFNNSISMGRPDMKEGFGPDGYGAFKFGYRISVYGSRVFVANNALPMSRGRNFKHRQITRPTGPKGGTGFVIKEPRESIVFFDYNKIGGIDVNKELLGITKETSTGKAGPAFFREGVTVRDNYVYNHGRKGFNLSGSWVTILNNVNHRQMLLEAWDPERIGGWELTLDGHLESAPGGNGAVSDNLSRAFDVGGKNLWVDSNFYDNLGSNPGIDGEGILCQTHGGSSIYSWALTRNRHERGEGHHSYMGGYDVDMLGCFFGWNRTPGRLGGIKMKKREVADVSFTGNVQTEADPRGHLNPTEGAQVEDPGGKVKAPRKVKAKLFEGDAVEVAWQDASDNEAAFRVDRRAGGGAWRTIAYRPAQLTGHKENPSAWIDFLAPRGVKFEYRVVAVDGKDDESGWDGKTAECGLPTAE